MHVQSLLARCDAFSNPELLRSALSLLLPFLHLSAVCLSLTPYALSLSLSLSSVAPFGCLRAGKERSERAAVVDFDLASINLGTTTTLAKRPSKCATLTARKKEKEKKRTREVRQHAFEGPEKEPL